MNVKHLPLAVLALSLGAATAVASDPTPQPVGLVSSTKARIVLERGIRAMGGLDALRDVQTIEREFIGGWSGVGQSHRPWQPEGGEAGPPLHERDHVTDYLDYAGNRSYESVTSTQYGRDKDVGIDTDAITEALAFHVNAYDSEKPLVRQVPAGEVRDSLMRRMRQHPEGVLLMALRRPETLALVASANEGARPQNVISFSDRSGATVFLYFDLQTSLLTKIESLRDNPIVGDTVAERVFSEYQPFGKLRLPTRYTDRLGRVRWQDWSLASVKINSDFPDEHFTVPPDHWDAPAAPDKPVVQPMGNDIYLIRGEYNVMFAVFNDFVLVFEAPLSNNFAAECLAIVKSIAPGKAIRLIATHFHYDHIAGIREYIARGVPLLTTVDAKNVIQRSAMASHTLRPDALSKSPQVPSVEAITSPMVFNDGTHEVVLYDFGPTDHAEHIIAAYFPQQKLLFEPDMWDVASPEFCYTSYDGVLLRARIFEHGLNVENIVPVHGVPGTLQMLDQAVEIRELHNR